MARKAKQEPIKFAQLDETCTYHLATKTINFDRTIDGIFYNVIRRERQITIRTLKYTIAFASRRFSDNTTSIEFQDGQLVAIFWNGDYENVEIANLRGKLENIPADHLCQLLFDVRTYDEIRSDWYK